jgi:hypothetical protein
VIREKGTWAGGLGHDAALSILSMATVVSPVQQRERTVQGANITERESNMYLSSRTRIDIIDKCGKALVL